MHIVVITSRFNESVTEKLHQGALERLREFGVDGDQITELTVPGAVELPLMAQQYAKRDVSAVICLGAVIRGETDHYDYVCQMVSQGCMDVSLKYDVPVIFGVLTTENADQAYDRVGGAHGHKGHDAADCALEMIELMRNCESVY